MADVNKKINNKLDTLEDRIDDLYSSTYHTSTVQDKIYDTVMASLDDSILKSTGGDDNYQNLSNISRLYQKLSKNITDDSITTNFGKGNDKDIASLFQSPELVGNIIDTYAKSKWVKELDNEFDVICKYMPKLQTALDIKKDAVLCSDSYSKEFARIVPKNDTQQSSKKIVLENNIENLKKKYDLENRIEKWYDTTSKYGEDLVYCVPYDVALKKLMERKVGNGGYSSVSESVVDAKGDIINVKNVKTKAEVKDAQIRITFDKSNILKESIDNNSVIRKAISNQLLTGLCESFNEAAILEAHNGDSTTYDQHISKINGDNTLTFDKTIPDDDLKIEDYDKTAASGLYDNKVEKVGKIKASGAVLRSIDHSKFIPIYIEDTFFGGYYIEFDIDSLANIDNSISQNTMNDGSVNSIFNAKQSSDSMSGDALLKTVSSKISNAIDTTFINANTDLSKEIYLMLKYNDKYNISNSSLDMNITFIPADDIHHLKFKEDPVSHRGISDLWDSLVSAKQWILLNTTTVLGQSIRGYDRRVYYVKQSLDTNVAQSLLNVISQIKKGNFGIRQMESVNNILGMLGRFNDFVIPMGPSGDAPIQFDTMPGQQFEFPSDTMQNLEESAINATGVPTEIVNSSTGMDFAVRYTMTNAKLLRNVLKRQAIIEYFCSKIITKLYFFEYGEYEELELKLPIPAFLSITQGQQLLQTVAQYADTRVEIDMNGEPDEAKAIFKKALINKIIPGYISEEEVEQIKSRVKMELNIANTGNDNGGGGDDNY